MKLYTVFLLAIFSTLSACASLFPGNTDEPETFIMKLTYYWTVSPEDPDVDMMTPTVNVLDCGGNVIAEAPQSLVDKISLEGSGFLPEPDGRLINLGDSPSTHFCFMVVDTTEAPWGLDSQGNALVPFYSVAVDPAVIPLGSRVYIAAFDGLDLPNGEVHDGYFLATDTSHSFDGLHIDVFAAKYGWYETVDEALERENVEVRLAP